MSACQQCGGLGEVDVSHGRGTRRVLCRCQRDKLQQMVALVGRLEGEVRDLRRELTELRGLLAAVLDDQA